ALPGVADAVVIGVPDPEWGQVVAAYVVSTSADDHRACPDREHLLSDPLPCLRERLRPTLPPHAVPRRVVVSDGIPQLASGKPDLAQLRAALASGDAPQT
ncbi:MAG: hypothetical protein Q4G34_11590, partial [Micrococcus sp.]|nr:hypothetical protein [Micrococcus sp.]